MTVDPKPAPQPNLPASPREDPRASSGYALLAKRLSSWTTKCVLTALVLVLGLGFGRQVIQWWAADWSATSSPQLAEGIGDRLGDSLAPHDIQFGASQWRIRRESVTGSPEQAVAALRASCRAATQASGFPESQPEGSEKRLLDSLADRKPVAQEPGKWAIYQLDDRFPMIVGTREPDAAASANRGQPVAGTRRRVVTWGLGLPASGTAWTLWTFHQATPVGESVPDLPLPPMSSIVVALRVEGGGAMMAFRGPARAESWKSFCDLWFKGRGWSAAAWRQSGTTWSTSYREKPDGPAAKVEVQFGEDGRGGLSGMLLLSPARLEVRS